MMNDYHNSVDERAVEPEELEEFLRKCSGKIDQRMNEGKEAAGLMRHLTEVCGYGTNHDRRAVRPHRADRAVRIT